MVVAARLYYVHGLRQRDIGERLGLSQTRVSRVLQRAEQEGIVRTVVAVPEDLRPDLEDELERRFNVHEVHLVGLPRDADLPRALGEAAARYLSEVSPQAEMLGFTSWSSTLQALADSMATVPRPTVRYVVEMLGDLGSPMLQHLATRATQTMARALGGEPVYLRTPGVHATPELRERAMQDVHVRRALDLLDDLDLAFVGVGPPAFHSRLQPGDSYFTQDQLAQARTAGAVGQLNQRFLDAAGSVVPTALDDLVVGSTLEQLRKARRRAVVAGGQAKHESIAAALRGGWVDLLITDVATGRALLAN